MPGVVTATDTGVQTITQLKATIEGDLNDAFSKLQRLATQLQDPSIWAGNDADRFRGESWPQVQKAMATFTAQLDELRNAVETTLKNIGLAGGSSL